MVSTACQYICGKSILKAALPPSLPATAVTEWNSLWMRVAPLAAGIVSSSKDLLDRTEKVLAQASANATSPPGAPPPRVADARILALEQPR